MPALWPPPQSLLEQAPGRYWPPPPFFPLPEERMGAVIPPRAHSREIQKGLLDCAGWGNHNPLPSASSSHSPAREGAAPEESGLLLGCRTGREWLGKTAGKEEEHGDFVRVSFFYSGYIYKTCLLVISPCLGCDKKISNLSKGSLGLKGAFLCYGNIFKFPFCFYLYHTL